MYSRTCSQVNFPAPSSTLRTQQSAASDVGLWGSHPLIPAALCMLTGESAVNLTRDGVYLRQRRDRNVSFVHWLSHYLNTGPFPVNHVSSHKYGGVFCLMEKS